MFWVSNGSSYCLGYLEAAVANFSQDTGMVFCIFFATILILGQTNIYIGSVSAPLYMYLCVCGQYIFYRV